MLDDAITELESAVKRGSGGEETAYISAASQLRKIVGTGRGNDLLERVVQGATLHRLPPIRQDVLDELDAGHAVSYYPGALELRGALGQAMHLEWQRHAAPIPIAEWRNEVLLVALVEISLGRFIQELGNQEGSHADEELAAVLAVVEVSARTIQIGGQPVRLAPALILSIGEYVVERTRELSTAS